VNASESSGNVRKFAVDILVRVDIDKAYADILLDQVLERGTVSEKDRSLLTELVYGTLRWRGRLDSYLKQLTRHPLEKTDPFIRNLLRITLYQIEFLDRIPEYAAINEAVNLAKAHAGNRISGFVNGVLRNFIRTRKTALPPNPVAAGITALAGYWSHPEWLIKNWIDYLGSNDIAPLLAACNRQAPLVLRVNVLRTAREALLTAFKAQGIEASPTNWSPQGIRVDSQVPLNQLPGHQEGLFQVQGESSQLVTYLLDPHPGENILDACAAPGGKTTHVAEFMGDGGQVTAIDRSALGIVKIYENSTRLGLKSIKTMQADMTKQVAGAQRPTYDRILVDAPCSGLGTLRSHPEIKWNRGTSDLTRLHKLQGKILERAASCLKSEGVLVYSTCTLSAVENENTVEEFLVRHREFVLEEAASYLPKEAKQLVRGNYFMALPHRHDTDGFFAARLKRVIRCNQ
jgi:16S rRNA (cytosine967-C5)-methyltransferase